MGRSIPCRKASGLSHRVPGFVVVLLFCYICGTASGGQDKGKARPPGDWASEVRKACGSGQAETSGGTPSPFVSGNRGAQVPARQAAAAKRAAKILASGGTQAVPVVLALLGDQDACVRAAAGQAVQQIRDVDAGDVGALIEALRYEEGRHYVIYLLGKIGERAVPALAEALGSDERAVSVAAARALGRIGPKAEPAVPHLISALNSGDSHVSSAALAALGHVGPGEIGDS